MAEPFLGQIKIFAGNFAPRGWAFCDGQLLPINQHSALFSLLGTTYGGDGRTTFALPDLRGRAPIHVGTGQGLSPRTMGQRGGLEQVTLTESQIPAHNHPANSGTVGNRVEAAGNYWSSDAAGNSAGFNTAHDAALMAVGAIDMDQGSTAAHNNMQPCMGLNFIIALQGWYPSRN